MFKIQNVFKLDVMVIKIINRPVEANVNLDVWLET